jgi:hypothetical protein
VFSGGSLAASEKWRFAVQTIALRRVFDAYLLYRPIKFFL